jgi:hypothetical protein
MKEQLLFVGISLVLSSLVVWVFASSEKVVRDRVNKMAHRFSRNSILTNLEIKKMILKGKHELDSQEAREQLQAINRCLDWQRKHSKSDATKTPQDLRGI